MRHFTPSRWFAARGGLIVSVAALVVLAGCGSTGGGSSGGGSSSGPAATSTSAPAATNTPSNATTIKITGASGNYSFQPATVSIPVGGTIIWENDTSVPHTSTSDSGAAFSWDSSTINSGGGTFSQVFSKAGTFAYHCNFHPFMHGSITVTG